MFTSNPFASVSEFLPLSWLQAYVLVMVAAVVAGTLFDIRHKGSAAFFAPEIAISPCSGTPPSMTSLSTLGLPLFRGKGLHRQRVDLLAHAVAEGRVDELVLLDHPLAAEQRAHDDGFEMAAVADHLDVFGLEALLDVLLDEMRIHKNQC